MTGWLFLYFGGTGVALVSALALIWTGRDPEDELDARCEWEQFSGGLRRCHERVRTPRCNGGPHRRADPSVGSQHQPS